MAGGIHECLLHSHECVGVEAMGLKEDIITQHRINGVSYYDLRGSLYFISKGLPAYTEETFVPTRVHNQVQRYLNCVDFYSIDNKEPRGGDLVGRIYKKDVLDPFMWEQPLDDAWITDLLEMVRAKPCE